MRWTASVSHPADVEGPEGLPSRAEQLKRLADKDAIEYDLLVIGGGATGAGIALDAACRGLKTACIERGDFASETSSRSTKLIWAGLKYMGTAVAGLLSPSKVWENGFQESWNTFVSEMRMVYHCHVERRYMTTQNKHLCHWIPIVVPFASWTMDPPPMNHVLFKIFPLVAPIVFKCYDALSGFTCPPSYILRPQSIAKEFPQLDADKLKYGMVFYEAQHNDARTNLAIALTAAERGAHIVNYVAAIDLTHSPQHGKVDGAIAVDRMTNKVFKIRAKTIVLAGGPFTDSLRRMEADNGDEVKPAVRGAHGTHVVLSGHLTPQLTSNHGGPERGSRIKTTSMGLLDCNTSDGRFLFVLPWLGHSLMGTTDQKGPAHTLPSPPSDDVSWILNESSKYYRDDLKSHFSKDRVLSAWTGWRPLAIDPHAAPGAPVSRDHVISRHPESGCWFIAGGKWTTWREMAQDVVDKLTNVPCTTLNVKLLGGDGYSDSLAEEVHAKYGQWLDRDICQHLVDTYGGRVWHVCKFMEGEKGSGSGHARLVEGYPYVEAEVRYACREYACTVEDVLSRRTRLAYLNRHAALQALPRVAKLMQQELRWTNAVLQQQMKAAQHYIESYGGSAAMVTNVQQRLQPQEETAVPSLA